MIDDNIQGPSGHYLELAQLLARAAQNIGVPSVLATHHSFQPDETTRQLAEVYPLFKTNNMVRWSLGVIGSSFYPRDLKGKNQGTSSFNLLTQKIKESFRHPSRRPSKMLAQWKESFHRLLEIIKLSKDDILLLNTADDFTLLALAGALKDRDLQTIQCHAIFHFATSDESTITGKTRNEHMRRQLSNIFNSFAKHQISIHATTEELAREIDLVMPHDQTNAIPYPTRYCQLADGVMQNPCRAMLAGMPREEKGKYFIHQFLQGLEREQLIDSSKYQPSLQLHKKNWRSIVPTSLHSKCQAGTINLVTDHLSMPEYQEWLNGSGIGIFLYDPIRYQVRCSGVLLEMLCRGVPVVVPDHSWLAQQVQKAGGHGSVGYIYQNGKEIPSLMKQFLNEREAITNRSRDFAKEMMASHSPDRTLGQMGLFQKRQI